MIKNCGFRSFGEDPYLDVALFSSPERQSRVYLEISRVQQLGLHFFDSRHHLPGILNGPSLPLLQGVLHGR